MDLQTLELRKNKILFDADAILKTAEKDSRGLTPDETKAYDQLLDKDLVNVKTALANLQLQNDQLAGIARLTDPDTSPFTQVSQGIARELSRVRGKSHGQAFIESAAFKYLTET